MAFRTLETAIIVSLAPLFVATAARAQTPADGPWSFDVSIGWDNSISGDFLSGAIGTLQGAPVTIAQRGWDDVYGTGLLFNLAAGYALNELTELRGNFTYQSTGADDTLTIGTYRGGALIATFDDYHAWSIDGGYRRYFATADERWRPYAGGSLGFGYVSGISVSLAQTAVNFAINDTDFYGGNGTFALGFNGGTLYRVAENVWVDARLGLRYTSGLSDAEGPAFTSLDDVNDDSSRWTLPLTVGIKVRF
jgi:hypothetical protein